MAKSSEHIFSWLGALDELNYYELFGVDSQATADEVREAFHAFCDVFHPDRHQGRTPAERAALSTIFKRSTEGYLVLSDLNLRGQYDRELAARPSARPPRMSHSARPRPPQRTTPRPLKIEDAARSPSSRPFARRADELIRSGDLRQAKLQLVMATHLEPANEELKAALKQIEAKLSERPGPA
jgi:curved DNA-binding protein CbpA